MSEIGEVIDQKLLSVEIGNRRYTYRAVFQRDEDDRIVVECPALEGCYTEGRTLDEAIEMIKDALKLSIESRLLLGEDVPEVEYKRHRPARMVLGELSFRFTTASS